MITASGSYPLGTGNPCLTHLSWDVPRLPNTFLKWLFFLQHIVPQPRGFRLCGINQGFSADVQCQPYSSCLQIWHQWEGLRWGAAQTQGPFVGSPNAPFQRWHFAEGSVAPPSDGAAISPSYFPRFELRLTKVSFGEIRQVYKLSICTNGQNQKQREHYRLAYSTQRVDSLGVP